MKTKETSKLSTAHVAHKYINRKIQLLVLFIMAMLAEPRQKKRYNLVSRGKPLYDADDNRFGKKLMEKMGWSKDKGLGAREDGSKEFVRVRYKHDVNGFGFEDRDDQWTQHEEQFSGLLKSLNNSENNSGEDDSNETSFQTVGFGFKNEKKSTESIKDKISGESLEEKSKSSKARVHYKKFTRGKDLTKCSEKDLANIFGKKVVSEVESPKLPYGVYPFEEKNETNSRDSEQPKTFGITTINTSVTVNDYFKSKMNKLDNSANYKSDDDKKKRKKKNKDGNDTTLNPDTNYAIEQNISISKILKVEESVDENIVQESKKKSKRNFSDEDKCTLEETEVIKKKRKKKNIDKDSIASNTADNENTEIVKLIANENVKNTKTSEKLDSTGSIEKQKKKSKKSKLLTNTNESINDNLVADVENEFSEIDVTKKKKKKKSTVDEFETQVQMTVNNIETSSLENIKTEKKKKRKELSADPELDSAEKIKENNVTEVVNLKKKKSKKSDSPFEEINLTQSNDSEVIESISEGNKDDDQTLPWTTVTKKKKSKSSSEEQSVQHIVQPEHSERQPEQLENGSPQDEKEQETPQIASTLNCAKYDTFEMNRDGSTLYVSSVFAEKFRHTNLELFEGSSIDEIVGYAMPDDIELKIIKNTDDHSDISRFWASAKNTQFVQYYQKVKAARKARKPLPKFNIKSNKRRKVFQAI